MPGSNPRLPVSLSDENSTIEIAFAAAWEVGQIVDIHRSEGVSDNTFVIFTSDNGPSLHKGPLAMYGVFYDRVYGIDY